MVTIGDHRDLASVIIMDDPGGEMKIEIDNIINFFNKLNEIPRCSGNEAGVRQWLMNWAKERGLSFQSDGVGNLVVRVPASPGHEDSIPIVIQGHMDMVCEKTPRSNHDFTRDPIVSLREGDWLTAQGTTLGSDNGIAIAYAMGLAEEDDLVRPPLELLFTVDEETGLNGVKGLEPGFVRGRILINLDSEDEGIVTIGCAGGVDSILNLDLPTETLSSPITSYRVVVGGLTGGHSGIDIHKHRGNANKILGRTLAEMAAAAGIRLMAIKGGSRKNAIPRDAWAVVAMEGSHGDELGSLVRRFEKTLQGEYSHGDGGLTIRLETAAEPASRALTEAGTRQVIDLVAAMPNGVIEMSATLTGLVETSCNLATADLANGRLCLVSSQRSAVMSRLQAITQTVHAVGRICGAVVEDRDEYPPWQPDMGSALLSRSRQVYRKLYRKDLQVQVIHAGLECAIIGDIYPGTDMISFGPDIRNAHSPDEKIHIPSVEKVWGFLKALVQELA